MTEAQTEELSIQEQNFWHWAYQVAAFTEDRRASYEAMKKQYAGIRPDASLAEREAAKQKLSSILRVTE